MGFTGCCCVWRDASLSALAGNNLEALMALGVAHTNELSQIQVVMTIMMRRCLPDAGAPPAGAALPAGLARPTSQIQRREVP